MVWQFANTGSLALQIIRTAFTIRMKLIPLAHIEKQQIFDIFNLNNEKGLWLLAINRSSHL
jgi:hypothetical protein